MSALVSLSVTIVSFNIVLTAADTAATADSTTAAAVDGVLTNVYFVVVVALLSVAALWFFLISSLRNESITELAAANIVLLSLVLLPLYIIALPATPSIDVANGTTLDANATAWVSITSSLHSSLAATQQATHIALAVLGLLMGGVYVWASIAVRQEFGWRSFLLTGNHLLYRRLLFQLRTFWSLWKFDLVFGILSLLAVWIFIVESPVPAVEAGLFALGTICTLGFSLATYFAVPRESKGITWAACLLGLAQPVYLIYLTADLLLQRVTLQSGRYASVWLSAVIPSVLAAAVARLTAIVFAGRLALRLYGCGMKGLKPQLRQPKFPPQVLQRMEDEMDKWSRRSIRAIVSGLSLGLSKVELGTTEAGRRGLVATIDGAVRTAAPADGEDADYGPQPLFADEFQQRFLQVSPDLTILRWSLDDMILVDQICSVVTLAGRGDDGGLHQLHLHYIDTRRRPMRLALQFDSPQRCSTWQRGLAAIRAHFVLPVTDRHLLLWMWDVFRVSDKDRSGLIEVEELPKLLSTANLHMDELQLQMIVEDHGLEGLDALNFRQVRDLLLGLRCEQPHALALFERYAHSWRHSGGGGGDNAEGGAPSGARLSLGEWVEFAREVQLEEDLEELETTFYANVGSSKGASASGASFRGKSSDAALRDAEAGGMALEGFVNALLSDENDVHDPARLIDSAERLGHPMAHYWINSSHNTYAVGDQLSGEASTDMYARVLLQGCRSVELDCFNADDGEPVVYHQHTAMTSVKVRDVLRAVLDYGFACSKLPITLSLEMHCGIAQQRRIAQLLWHYFGESIVLPPSSQAVGSVDVELPSPLELRGRVLIKGVCLDHFGVSGHDEFDEVAQPRDGAAEPSLTSGTRTSIDSGNSAGGKEGRAAAELASLCFFSKIKYSRLFLPGQPCSPFEMFSLSETKALRLMNGGSVLAVDAVDSPEGGHHSPRRGGSARLGLASAPPVRLASSPRRDATTSSEGQSWLGGLTGALSSMVAGASSGRLAAASEWAQDDPMTAVQLHSRRSLTRVYPKARRVLSDNLDPLPFWRAGLQMVALNFQTYDLPMQLNRALFRLGGGGGYVLKPPWLRSGDPRAQPPAKAETVRISILSLHHLPVREEYRPEYVEPHEEIERLSVGTSAAPPRPGHISAPRIVADIFSAGGGAACLSIDEGEGEYEGDSPTHAES